MNAKKIYRPLILIAVLLVFWQYAVGFFEVPAHILPTPLSLLDYTYVSLTQSDLMKHITITLKEVLIGTFYGILLGIVLGYGIAKSKFIDRLLTPLVLIVQIAPKISLAPLFILWFGLGMTSKIALVILVVSFPVMVTQSTALRTIDKNYIDFMKVIHANKWQQFISVELPYSLKSVLSGVKVSVTQGLTGAVIGEMMGAQAGLGYLLTYGSEMYDIQIILSSVVILSILGIALYYIADFAEKKLVFWE